MEELGNISPRFSQDSLFKSLKLRENRGYFHMICFTNFCWRDITNRCFFSRLKRSYPGPWLISGRESRNVYLGGGYLVVSDIFGISPSYSKDFPFLCNYLNFLKICLFLFVSPDRWQALGFLTSHRALGELFRPSLDCGPLWRKMTLGSGTLNRATAWMFSIFRGFLKMVMPKPRFQY